MESRRFFFRGFHREDGICVECGGGDYALVTVVAILLCVCISILYIAPWLAWAHLRL